MRLGVDSLPALPKDTTDRNRTSPFAFTGNKFEFRSLGSSNSVSGPNITLNTIVAEELSKIADTLEIRLNEGEEWSKAVGEVIRDTINAHKRIIYNGNNYSKEWIAEAKTRGLLNLRTTPDALPHFVAKKNIDLYTKHHVFTETEMRSRNEIHFESYYKVEMIEARTMVDMINKDILPSVIGYKRELAESVIASNQIGLDSALEMQLADEINHKLMALNTAHKSLIAAIESADKIGDWENRSYYIRDGLIPAMDKARAAVDELEVIVGREHWCYPTYSELLFSI